MKTLISSLLATSLFFTSHLAAAQEQCLPSCRSGYTCIKGQCVSLCNPPCDAGQSCNSVGECTIAPVAPAPTAPAPRVPLVPVPGQPVLDGPLADPGWAHGASTFGYVAAGFTLLGTLVTVSAEDDPDTSIPMGGLTTLAFTISAPIVAIGGGSARNHPLVTGASTLRTTSWIGYGVTVAISLGMLAAAIDGEVVDTGLVTTTGLLGALTLTGFALDAKASAKQADIVRANQQPQSGFRVAPLIGSMRDRGGNRIALFGVQGTL